MLAFLVADALHPDALGRVHATRRLRAGLSEADRRAQEQRAGGVHARVVQVLVGLHRWAG